MIENCCSAPLKSNHNIFVVVLKMMSFINNFVDYPLIHFLIVACVPQWGGQARLFFCSVLLKIYHTLCFASVETSSSLELNIYKACKIDKHYFNIIQIVIELYLLLDDCAILLCVLQHQLSLVQVYTCKIPGSLPENDIPDTLGIKFTTPKVGCC